MRRLGLNGKVILAVLATSAVLVVVAVVATRQLLMGTIEDGARHDRVLHETQQIALLVSKAADGAASYALTFNPTERTEVFEDLAGARQAAAILQRENLTPAERAALDVALADITRNEHDSHAVLDGAAIEMPPYLAFDDSLDVTEADVATLEARLRETSAATARATERRANVSVWMVGLATIVLAVLVGIAVARKLTRPLVALRDAVLAFGPDGAMVETPIPDDEIGDVALAFRSMTGRVRADHVELTNAHTELVDVFASVEHLLVVVDDDDRVLIANPRATELVDRGDLVGTPLSEFLPEISGDALVRGDMTLVSRTEQIPVRAIVSRLRSGRGRVICASDRRAQLALEADLRAAQRLEEIGRMAAGIAHEIRSPLQYIGDSLTFVSEAQQSIVSALERYRSVPPVEFKGHVEAFDGAAATASSEDVGFALAEVGNALASVNEGVERVSSIVKAMQEFAHPGQTAVADTDVNRLVTSTLAIARHEYKYVADLKTELRTIPPIPCMPGELGQAVLNLVVNAAHAIADTGKRGTIKVTTALTTETVVISVSDTGTGITPEARTKLFEPFFTTKERGRGTGQGLALVQRVVEAHHGRVTYETEVGTGTTFHVILPRDFAKAS